MFNCPIRCSKITALFDYYIMVLVNFSQHSMPPRSDHPAEHPMHRCEPRSASPRPR